MIFGHDFLNPTFGWIVGGGRGGGFGIVVGSITIRVDVFVVFRIVVVGHVIVATDVVMIGGGGVIAYFAFDALNQFTGFDYLNPWQIDDIVQEETGNSVNYYFGFTETDSYSDQFAWMGVDQANFVYNTGSISFVLIFIMVRSAVIPLLNFLIRRGYTGPGRIIHKTAMTLKKPKRCWTRIIMACRRSRREFWSTWPCSN